MEIEDWEATTTKMNALNIRLIIVYVIYFGRQPTCAEFHKGASTSTTKSMDMQTRRSLM